MAPYLVPAQRRGTLRCGPERVKPLLCIAGGAFYALCRGNRANDTTPSNRIWIVSRPRNIQAVAFLALGCFGILGGCVREKPAPPASKAPAAGVREKPAARDLAGNPRDPKRGITPGALEAEGPPPPPKKPEKRTKNS